MKSLRKIRLYKGLHLEHVSIDCGITIASLSHIERGKQSPGKEIRDSLEKYFGEHINWLDTPELKIEAINPASNWTDTERQFRGLIRQIKSLSAEEQKAFVTSAIRHMKNIIDK